MNAAERFLKFAQSILPSPFTIAVILTVVTFLLCYVLVIPRADVFSPDAAFRLAGYWQNGFWGFLEFGMQMILILVLGHVLALTKPVKRVMNLFLPFCSTTARAAAIVTFATVVVAYFNWGLGLIFGAIMVRKVAEYAQENSLQINYPLVGAAGYSGLMVWHGGLSASAPLKVAEEGHNLVQQIGVIPAGETIGSTMNLVVILLTVILLPATMYLIGRKVRPGNFTLPSMDEDQQEAKVQGAERLDRSLLVALFFGGVMVVMSIRTILQTPDIFSLSFLKLNFINFFLFGLGLILHGSISKFIAAAHEAISGATGILIQFPLYAGIMGMMSGSGLITLFSKFIAEISSPVTYPIFTFISAGIVNIFVPSGGGQWIIQGPVVVEAAKEVGVPVSKSIMALAYGDELTNMLQPFWALPLLGITGLKAKEILPYTFLLFLVGLCIFGLCLMIF